jgi:hypothetical protein
MSDFYEDLETIKMHQIASGCQQNLFPIKSTKQIFRFFQRFFSEFSQKILFVQILPLKLQNIGFT